MTPSPELERLRVRVRELEEEVAEWERQGAAPDVVGGPLVWALALGMRPQAANVVIHLCQAPGQFLSRWYIHDAIVENGQTTNIVNVAVCHARTALKAIGLTIISL